MEYYTIIRKEDNSRREFIYALDPEDALYRGGYTGLLYEAHIYRIMHGFIEHKYCTKCRICNLGDDNE